MVVSFALVEVFFVSKEELYLDGVNSGITVCGDFCDDGLGI